MSEHSTPQHITRAALQQGLVVPFAKPEGWTSFSVVNKVRAASRVKKVGHAGTLDPFATGLLLICFGKATKQVESLMSLKKEYRTVIKLGVETDTHDLTGKVVHEAPVAQISREQLEALLQKFTGEIEQVPPMFSALKHKGKRLYELARQGKTVERAPRKVTIYDLELISHKDDLLELRFVCSRGTYIRALARDIGRELGCGAHIVRLERTRIGEYTLESAWKVSDFLDHINHNRTADESL